MFTTIVYTKQAILSTRFLYMFFTISYVSGFLLINTFNLYGDFIITFNEVY
jgi:hypothetical protein